MNLKWILISIIKVSIFFYVREINSVMQTGMYQNYLQHSREK